MKLACVVVQLIALGLIASLSTADAPRERDAWYVVVDGDLRDGSHHVQVTALPDGNYRYQTATRQLLDLFGVQRQEITSDGECVVTPGLRPISFRSEATTMSGTTLVTGWMDGDTLTIVASREEGDATSTFQFGPSETVIADVSLADWLATRPETVEEASARVLDQASGRISTMTARRSFEEPRVWNLSAGSVQTTTLIFGDDGVIVERLTRMPTSHAVRCSPEEAADLDYRTWSGRELLTFPVDQDITAPHRLTALTVELRWTGIPFDEFNLDDGRQHLLEQSESDGQYLAVVSIGDPDPIPEGVTFPVTDVELAPFLAETEFIKPSDERIVQAARDAVAGRATAIDAVRALSEWVNGYIESALIAETLSGPEVLARRTGKCSEYSTLFASMARSVGIPARVVLGERLVGAQWMGHMWCEAYVGRWVPVDASANEVGESFALLKFVDSDTVNGTQPLRWRLTESLEIHVRDFEMRPSDLAGRYRTGVDGLVYTSVDYGCRIAASAPFSTLDDLSTPGVPTIRFRVSGEDDVHVHFVAFSIPDGTKPSVLARARIGVFRAASAEFEVQRDEELEIAGLAGHATCFLGVSDDSPDTPYTTSEYIWVNGSVGYLLNMIAPEAKHDEYLASFEKLLASFELLEE